MRILAITLVLLIHLLASNSHARELQQNRELSTQLSQAVFQLNTQLPKMIDEETRLDSAATLANFMIYNNVMINYQVEQLDPDKFAEILKETVLGSLCENQALQPFISLGVVMVYRYLDKNGNFITEISKDMGNC